MTSEVFALVLLAALMHASWNALVKGAGDRVASVMAINWSLGVIAAPFALWRGLPPPETLAIAVVSAATHGVYFWLLAHAYRLGDLSVIYPLARGTAPLLIVAIAALALGAVPEPIGLAGVGIVSVGIMALGVHAARHAHSPPPIAFAAALAIGVLIAAYTVLDGLGGRSAGAPVAYALWLFVLLPVGLSAVVALERGRGLFRGVGAALKYGIPGGIVAGVGYGIVIWAMSQAPIPYVSAVRESSIVIAALIGTIVFREAGGRMRLAAAAVVALGVVLIRFAG